MSRKPRQPEHLSDLDEAGDDAAPRAEGTVPTPMDRFKTVTRRLLGVSREQLLEAQRRYENVRERRRKTDR